MSTFYKLQDDSIIKFIEEFNENCTNCNNCKCLMMESLDISMKDFTSIVLLEGFTKKQAFSCVDCLQCSTKCNLDVNRVFNSLKTDLSCQFESNKVFNTPYILQKQVKLNHKVIKPSTKVVFMPGCTLRKYYPNLISKVMNILKSFDNQIQLYEGCCTKPIKLLGKTELHNSYLDMYEKEFSNTLIITGCFSCERILNKRVKTITIYEYMLENNLVNISNNRIDYSVKLPCHLSDKHKDLCINFCNQAGISVTNSDSTCCGSGGLIGYSNYRLSKQYLNNTINNLKSKDVICFCAECNSKIRKHKKSKHILEYL